MPAASQHRRHSALYWAAHIGGVGGWVTLAVGLVVAGVVGVRLGSTIALVGVTVLPVAGILAVLGYRRHHQR